MGFSVILLLALGLSMDAFAVSLTNGMCYRMPPLKNALYSGLAFGLAQGLMPLIGYFAGHSFSAFIGDIADWVALILLCLIGLHMIWESLQERRDPESVELGRCFSGKVLLGQAVATSIDALAAGLGLGVLRADLLRAVVMIASVTFFCCFAGVLIGHRFGQMMRDKAGILGGVILVTTGIRIFVGGL